MSVATRGSVPKISLKFQWRLRSICKMKKEELSERGLDEGKKGGKSADIRGGRDCGAVPMTMGHPCEKGAGGKCLRKSPQEGGRSVRIQGRPLTEAIQSCGWAG